ncbi:PREDICTED: uncharacterized protein LOC105962671 [Erythranthe guttata]|uniref:uncharacterized protein LOC105962671 n=1 Tax=Erythranthe guttata TaxID=4155 RepID=UPI00064DE50F|nr:PREDICTED: uncharacterized protein LOC105962671 [Erythranthe guttata]|eukprot:XP_012842438.1 PREDICTED: uncharacterized protein LOC105962671 [Erythranthe guttata]
MGSISDSKLALARHSKMIKNCMFRLFRWTPDFQIGKDSCIAPVWVRFPKLPIQYFNISSLERIGACLGTVLSADDRTLGFTHQMYARVCIEIDVSQPFPQEIWIDISKDQGWWQKVEYEGNIAYCSYCGLLGHTAGCCRKNVRVTKPQSVPKPKTKTEYVPKKVVIPLGENKELLASEKVVGTSGEASDKNNAEKISNKFNSPVQILKRSDIDPSRLADMKELLKGTGLLSDEETDTPKSMSSSHGNRFALLSVENFGNEEQQVATHVTQTHVDAQRIFSNGEKLSSPSRLDLEHQSAGTEENQITENHSMGTVVDVQTAVRVEEINVVLPNLSTGSLAAKRLDVGYQSDTGEIKNKGTLCVLSDNENDKVENAHAMQVVEKRKPGRPRKVQITDLSSTLP